MFVYDAFLPMDLLSINLVNLDEKTMSFSLDFYFQYMREHSANCCKAMRGEAIAGYIIGADGVYKGSKDEYLHITALSVAPMFRRFRVGQRLLKAYDLNAQENKEKFIDLFVRLSNKQAVHFYKKNGYGFHKTIQNYYCDPVEDAYEMRKTLDE
ncbi:N-terminal acetyltransferase B complex catalytic subunit [Nematocida sp. AWRm77]|nr:N-terminal acetyltransferase B complex catalytic subunit [Nematocida sp. AWRm77]